MTADRRKRHLKILEIISTHAMHTQEELAEALAAGGLGGDPVLDEPGHHGVAAGEGGRRLSRAAASERPRHDPDEQRIAEGVLTCEPAGDALIVLHTPPGEANRVGAALDRLAWPDIVGTICRRRHDIRRGEGQDGSAGRVACSAEADLALSAGPARAKGRLE